MIPVSDFLSAFRQSDEAIHLRAFKPKGAPDTDENRPQKWATTLVELRTDSSLQREIREKNKNCGIYWVVNAGGDTDASIKRYTAWFAENDSLSISEQHQRLDASPLPPSVRNETRNSVHGFWLIDGPCSGAEWREIQGRLIVNLGSDPKIKNPSRVMRLPNFNHLHLNGKGLERKKVEIHTFEHERRYTVSQMLAAFPAPKPENVQNASLHSRCSYEYHEDRHDELCQRIMSRGRRNSKGNWDARCQAHDGNGKTGLVYFPKSGAVKCNAEPKCDYFSILRAEGLPDKHLPSRESAEIAQRREESKKAVGTESPVKKICTAKELIALTFPALRWAILSLLAEGLFILAGRPKLGKSWLVLNFCLAIASGGYALGTIRVEAGDVLYCALEDGARRLQERLRRALRGGGIPDATCYKR